MLRDAIEQLRFNCDDNKTRRSNTAARHCHRR